MKLSEDLTCAELVELVTDYVDGALDDVDRQRFEEHVILCNDCAGHLDQMRATIAVVGRLSEETIPPEAAADLLDAFRGWKRT